MKRYHTGQKLLLNGQEVTVERHIGGGDYIVTSGAAKKRFATNIRFLAEPVQRVAKPAPGAPSTTVAKAPPPAPVKAPVTTPVVPASTTTPEPTGSDTTEYTGWSQEKLSEELIKRGYQLASDVTVDDMVEALINDDAEAVAKKT